MSNYRAPLPRPSLPLIPPISSKTRGMSPPTRWCLMKLLQVHTAIVTLALQAFSRIMTKGLWTIVLDGGQFQNQQVKRAVDETVG